jgi:hypothetical protein
MDQAGQPFESPMKRFSRGRGDRPVARSARRRVRKPAKACRKRARPADAFCPEAPCPRATTKHSGNVNAVLDTEPPAEPGVYRKEIKED